MRDKKHIMIVDDDISILESLQLMLEDAGYNVHTATDGDMLYHILHHMLPDLIILDYKLPKITGTEIAQNLKSDDQTKEIPIMMISSHDVKDKAEKVGVSAVFEKPYDIDEVITTIQKQLRH